MGSESQKKLGLNRRGDLLSADPFNMFIIGLDGDGADESERRGWLTAIFPKLADRIDALKNRGRADGPIPEWLSNAFQPSAAKPVDVENFAVVFPEGSGSWSGKPLIVVVDGRHTTRCFRSLNEARKADNAPALECPVIQRKFQNALAARELKAIRNVHVEQTPMVRAWLAQEFADSGMPLSDITWRVGVTSEQAVRNLLVLCDASESVARAVDLGSDNGGITQTVAQEIVKGRDHAAQDAELAKRLGAAEGKGKRERSQALRGESLEVKPKAVKPAQLARVVEKLTAIDRTTMVDATRVDEWKAIALWALGDEAGFDALPDEFRSAVIAAEKKEKKSKVKAAAEEPANDDANECDDATAVGYEVEKQAA